MLFLFYEDFTLKLPLSVPEVNQRFSGMVFHGKNPDGESIFTFPNQNETEKDFYTPQFRVTLSPIGNECYVIVRMGLWQESRDILVKRLVQLFIPEWWCAVLSSRIINLWWLPLPLLVVILVLWIYYVIRFSVRAKTAKLQFLELFSGAGGELLPPVNVFTDEIHLFG